MTKLGLGLGQHLQLTAQLQQALRLLQMSALELQEEVQQKLLDNPFLEAQEGPENTDSANHAHAADSADNPAHPDEAIKNEAASAHKQEVSDTNHAETQAESVLEAPEFEGFSWDTDGPRSPASDGEDGLGPLDLASQPPSLTAHLHQQAASLHLCPEEQAALYFLIENLSDTGYLEGSLPTLAAAISPEEDPTSDTFATLLHHLQVALHLLQQMEPTGVGARTTAECLRLQLLARPATPERALALQLCEQPLELLARKDLRRLSSLCRAPSGEIEHALRLIAQLEPQPGRHFAPITHYSMVPDVLVQPSGQGWQVTLNPAALPRLQVHEVYARALRQHRQHASHAGLHAQLQEARWYVKSLTQRFDTILRVAQAIVQQQRGFFQHGPVAMRPLVLRDVAQMLQVHESTISRASNGKFMATPHGTFELNYFFSSGLATDTGGSTSSTAVQAVIAQLIAAENRQKPLSDAKIADLLAEQGIECARRTVAKYREGLGIAVASLRKSL